MDRYHKPATAGPADSKITADSKWRERANDEPKYGVTTQARRTVAGLCLLPSHARGNSKGNSSPDFSAIQAIVPQVWQGALGRSPARCVAAAAPPVARAKGEIEVRRSWMGGGNRKLADWPHDFPAPQAQPPFAGTLIKAQSALPIRTCTCFLPHDLDHPSPAPSRFSSSRA